MFEGPSREAVNHYLSAVSRAYAVRPTDIASAPCRGDTAIQVEHLKFRNDKGCETPSVRQHESLRAELAFRAQHAIERLIVELNMRASAHENVLSFNSGRDDLTFGATVGVNTVNLVLPRIPLAGGQYFWNVRMWNADTGETLVDTPLQFPLLIDDEGRASGSLTIEREWGFAAAPVEGRAAIPIHETSEQEEPHEDLLLRE